MSIPAYCSISLSQDQEAYISKFKSLWTAVVLTHKQGAVIGQMKEEETYVTCNQSFKGLNKNIKSKMPLSKCWIYIILKDRGNKPRIHEGKAQWNQSIKTTQTGATEQKNLL